MLLLLSAEGEGVKAVVGELQSSCNRKRLRA